jgi:hypothetical protein
MTVIGEVLDGGEDFVVTCQGCHATGSACGDAATSSAPQPSSLGSTRRIATTSSPRGSSRFFRQISSIGVWHRTRRRAMLSGFRTSRLTIDGCRAQGPRARHSISGLGFAGR